MNIVHVNACGKLSYEVHVNSVHVTYLSVTGQNRGGASTNVNYFHISYAISCLHKLSYGN